MGPDPAQVPEGPPLIENEEMVVDELFTPIEDMQVDLNATDEPGVAELHAL